MILQSVDDSLVLSYEDHQHVKAVMQMRFGKRTIPQPETPETEYDDENKENSDSPFIRQEDDGTVLMVVEPTPCDENVRRSKRVRKVKVKND